MSAPAFGPGRLRRADDARRAGRAAPVPTYAAIRNRHGAIRPVTVKLTGFGEARVIGEKFREGKPVILDMTEMDDAGARRLVDFAAGLAFALRGSIDKVTTKVFMLLPPDTDAADIPAYEPAHAGFSGGYGSESTSRQAYAGARAGR